MRQVITVSLNGCAYELEDEAYAVLTSYLDGASRALYSNPDRDEIVTDLEQAIADKCARYLNPNKTVISRIESDAVIAEMGPVDGDGSESADTRHETAGSEHAAFNPAPGEADREAKCLYQISDGAMLSGVCNGIAAYLAVDVTLVRLIFVVLSLRDRWRRHPRTFNTNVRCALREHVGGARGSLRPALQRSRSRRTRQAQGR